MNPCQLCGRIRLGAACGRCDRGPSVRVTVPTTMPSAYSSPALLGCIQRAVQEAVLRYNTLNRGDEP